MKSKFKVQVSRPDGSTIHGGVLAVDREEAAGLVHLKPGYSLKLVEELPSNQAYFFDKEFEQFIDAKPPLTEGPANTVERIELGPRCSVEINRSENQVVVRYSDGSGMSLSLSELATYLSCRVCGKPLDSKTFAWSLWNHIPMTCSTACSQAEQLKRYACCDKAQFRNCVCVYSTECPVHGIRCHGSHD